MNIYINKILNESEKNKVNYSFKSCIIFIYKQNNSFLNELEKFNIQEIGKNEGKKQRISFSLIKGNQKRNSPNKIDNEFENIKIFTSDICGLGKSFRIKKIIQSKNKEYFYFPLGGILNKNIIYEKLFKLIKKLNKEYKDNYEKIAIHLDLKESKEISIINEFLFSFLITKFYINSENIIYIPKEIEIYIEISNGFENYISELNILKIFNIENISLDGVPKLELQEDSKKVFNEILKLSSTK